jgi:hypothetical protein
MGTFVNTKAKQRIDLDQEGNFVVVRQKMDFSTQAALERDLMRFRIDTKEKGNVEVLFSKSGQNLAILKHNLVSWGGPMFCDDFGKPVPCTAENIERLDPLENNDWISLVADKVAELNKPRVIEADPENNLHDPNELAPDSDS